MQDLFIEQAQRRGPTGQYKAMDMSEFKAVANLGKGIFRRQALLEFGKEEPGVVYLGYYKDPPSVPSHRRRRKLIFRFVKCSELEEQIRLFKTMTSAEQDGLWGSGLNI
jgi:hypothetical protein